MEVPTVTLEDLQAFQAQHFPRLENQHVPPTQSTEDNDYYEEAGDEEDLEYYPDGVKRTLTDEQIRIFRHSEIHALLRARQLEQDDAEYEARRDASEEEPVDEEQVRKGQKAAEVKEDDVPAAKRPKRSVEQVDSAPPGLDYEEAQQPSSPKKFQKQNGNMYPSRKIVSYND